MRIKRFTVLLMAVAFSTSVAAPALAQDSVEATGLERARQAAAVAMERVADETVGGSQVGGSQKVPPGLAKKKARGNRPDKATGRDRAAEAIAEGLARGNGNGHGHGRGHSAGVLQNLLDGTRPAILEESAGHGAKVSAMVAAHNELRRQERRQD